jgi:ribonuclease VapC
MVAESRTVLGG